MLVPPRRRQEMGGLSQAEDIKRMPFTGAPNFSGGFRGILNFIKDNPGLSRVIPGLSMIQGGKKLYDTLGDNPRSMGTGNPNTGMPEYFSPNNAASYGRFGDSELRNVDGKKSHVSPLEAFLIDKFGKKGEAITKGIGSGTINPNTGKKEYFLQALLPYVPQILGVGSQLYSAYKGSQGPSQQDLMGNYGQYTGHLDELRKQAGGLMDPNSQINTQQRQQIMQNAMDQQAFGNQLNQRKFAQGGGGFSGVQNQQRAADLQRTRAMAGGQAQQSAMKNYGIGLNQMNQLTGEYAGLGDMRAQHMADSMGQQNAMWGALGGLGQGLMGYGLSQEGYNVPEATMGFPSNTTSLPAFNFGQSTVNPFSIGS